MKKICFVTTISGTLRVFVLKLAEYLHENTDWDISFICSTDNDFAQMLPDYIHYFQVPMERGISISGIKAMLQMRKIMANEKFDLVQYSTPNASCYASIAAWLSSVPVRLYCQLGLAYVGFSGIKRRIFKLEEKMVCSLSTWVEPDSKGNLNFSHDEGLYSNNKGSVIWNGSASGVDLTRFDIEKKTLYCAEIRKKLKIPKDSFVYGFVGRITGDKGVNELFSAAKTVLANKADAYLILVGHEEKSESVNSDLYDWAVTNSRVIFAGYTSEAEKYISAMDCYVLPSYREGFGMAVVEAEAMGIPVIVTNIPGPTDAMLPGETGLIVEKKNVDSLIEGMEKMYIDPNMRNAFSLAGVNFARSHFEQQILFKKILDDRDHLLEEIKR